MLNSNQVNISLPFQLLEMVPFATTQPGRMNSNSNNPATLLSDRYILLADDDEDDRMLMSDFFSSNGYKNKILSSGSAVLSFLQSLTPDSFPSLIILDHSMPQLNGAEVMVLIKTSEKLQHIPIIIHSSDMNARLQSHLLASGAHTCLSKARQEHEWNTIKVTIEALLYSKQPYDSTTV